MSDTCRVDINVGGDSPAMTSARGWPKFAAKFKNLSLQPHPCTQAALSLEIAVVLACAGCSGKQLTLARNGRAMTQHAGGGRGWLATSAATPWSVRPARDNTLLQLPWRHKKHL